MSKLEQTQKKLIAYLQRENARLDGENKDLLNKLRIANAELSNHPQEDEFCEVTGLFSDDCCCDDCDPDFEFHERPEDAGQDNWVAPYDVD